MEGVEPPLLHLHAFVAPPEARGFRLALGPACTSNLALLKGSVIVDMKAESVDPVFRGGLLLGVLL